MTERQEASGYDCGILSVLHEEEDGGKGWVQDVLARNGDEEDADGGEDGSGEEDGDCEDGEVEDDNAYGAFSGDKWAVEDGLADEQRT